MNPKLRVMAVVATPGVQMLDVAGPLDVFAEANVQARRELYQPRVIATRPGELRGSSGVRLAADTTVARSGAERFDTLLVAGSPHAADEHHAPAMLEWLRAQARTSRRYGSVCSGAFMLGAAGLLERRRVTTHWGVAERLAAAYPGTEVDVDAIYVRDGKLRTAAGVTAGLDLALALVEEDHGHELATAVAAQLVMFFRRPGGQLSFSRHGQAVPAGRSALQEIQRWAAAHPAEDLSVAALAARMRLSPRHFARLFRSEVGVTPASWVEASRIAAARRLLEGEHAAPKQVAALCGFADADTLRRAFRRHVGITPADYRRRYTG